MLKLLKRIDLVRISASRAAAARMWPAWYYLTGIRALDAWLEYRECTARWHEIVGFQNYWDSCGFPLISARARGQEICNFFNDKHWFLRLLCWNPCKHNVFGRISAWARACPLCRIFCKGLLKFVVLRQEMVRAWYFLTGMRGGRYRLAWHGMNSYGKRTRGQDNIWISNRGGGR